MRTFEMNSTAVINVKIGSVN